MPLKKGGVKSSSKKPLKKGGVKSSSKKPLKKGGVKDPTLPSSQNPPSELALLQQELTKMSALIKSLKESQIASQNALSVIYRR
jgi:hypothetical protein